MRTQVIDKSYIHTAQSLITKTKSILITIIACSLFILHNLYKNKWIKKAMSPSNSVLYCFHMNQWDRIRDENWRVPNIGGKTWKTDAALGVCRAGQIARYIFITNFIFRRCKFLAALLSKAECFFIVIFKLNSRQDKGSLDFSGVFYLSCCHCIHPFEVISHSNQLPLARYCLNPSHQELAKA